MSSASELYPPRGRRPALLSGLVVAIVSFFTYVLGYWNPAALFWDENYHIASAQKYLHGTFFMEPHPPLGKLLIALGEVIVSPDGNGADDQFLGTDHASETPEDFSFLGFRLVPTLCGWLIAPTLFAIFLQITNRHLLAAILTTPYVFDNAMIVHSRSAMLESTLGFFAMAMVLLFLVILRRRANRRHVRIGSLLLGVCFGAVLTTKATGLVMGLLYVPLFCVLIRDPVSRRSAWDALALNALGFLVVFVGVWQVHFSLASAIHPSLPNDGYYRASEEYKRVLSDGENASVAHFGVMLKDSLAFFRHYQHGVPKLDLCKSDENGSPWFLWPIGARAINYRWETPGGGDTAPYRYLYLQSNPIGWLLGLMGMVLAGVLFVGSWILPLRRPIAHRFLLGVFLGLYVGYMAAMSQLDRVMYLYHYFPPLLFSYILFGIAVGEIRQVAGWRIDSRRRLIVLMLCAVGVIGSFQFYRPLTYYEPITDAAFAKRSVLRLWDLHCARCDRVGPLVRQTCS